MLYLKDIIRNLKKPDTWKIQSTIASNFTCSIYNDEERVIHSKSGNIEIVITDKADKVIKELFDLDPPDLIKNKRATMNPINKKDNKCFQYAVTFVSNHKEIRKHSERITKIKPLINRYNWERINFSSEKDD